MPLDDLCRKVSELLTNFSRILTRLLASKVFDVQEFLVKVFEDSLRQRLVEAFEVIQQELNVSFLRRVSLYKSCKELFSDLTDLVAFLDLDSRDFAITELL